MRHAATCSCCKGASPSLRLRFHADRVDPTKTTLIRRKYAAEMGRRFGVVRRLVREKIQSGSFTLRTNAPTASSPARHTEFMAWLREQINEHVLEVSKAASAAPLRRSPWQDLYIRAAYRRGMDSAAQSMRKAGVPVDGQWVDAAFRRPFHADRVAMIYTRAYAELEGVTKAMESRMSASLATSMAHGWGVEQTAKALVKAVDAIGITRARMIARTETMSAHADATLNSYEDAGIEGVNVLSEFSSSRDNKVCPRCQELEGQRYSIEEARGVIPVHPNCRCAWLPVIDDEQRARRAN